MASDEIIREVYKVLEERRDNPIDSYTSKIMQDSDKKAELKCRADRFNVYIPSVYSRP